MVGFSIDMSIRDSIGITYEYRKFPWGNSHRIQHAIEVGYGFSRSSSRMLVYVKLGGDSKNLYTALAFRLDSFRRFVLGCLSSFSSSSPSSESSSHFGSCSCRCCSFSLPANSYGDEYKPTQTSTWYCRMIRIASHDTRNLRPRASSLPLPSN